ncbi:MAG: ABC transporter substrate-binding protein [Gammaproteobacteria bacterium]|nr:ABC transporter substrate-binding protein [Gammaproteobacteria bacterium]
MALLARLLHRFSARGGWSTLALAVLLAGCGEPPANISPEPSEIPQRIVSLDYCADQYVLRLVERKRILAVSPHARREFSYMRAAATGLPSVRPVAEDVIVRRPDLVVRSYGGGPQAAAMFARAGIAVHQLGWADDFPSILRTIREAAEALGSIARGQALVDETMKRLTRLSRHHAAIPPTALYMTPAGVTSGPGSLIHTMLNTAGLQNFETQPGWRPIPLERLAYEQPDLIAAAFFESATNHPHAWSAARHPVAQSQLKTREVIPIQGAWTACGGWFLMDAVEALSKGSRRCESEDVGELCAQD